MGDEQDMALEARQTARIAVYDDLLSAPRVVDIEPMEISSYIEEVATKTYELSQAQGGVIPYTVIREVVENFIHADFAEPCISILDKGNTLRFADQGPGIEHKDLAQQPGFTSATSNMKKYIRGVGSGLPIVKEYLRFSNGRLVIENNIKSGTVITVTIEEPTQASPRVQAYITQTDETAAAGVQLGGTTQQRPVTVPVDLQERDYDVLRLANTMASVGPTDVAHALGLSTTTAYRVLEKLESAGLLEMTGSRKRVLTDLGLQTLQG
ncbi:MAG: ATP-binding protein [Coriobacteriaceae bacterium]|nr:ATP-binding protein [Coriobacteriaceae bacterium]